VKSGVEEPRYAPWVGGPFLWRLGLRPLDLADWIQIGDDYAEELAAKANVRDRHPETVFVALPRAAEACHEVLDAVVDHLTVRWPDDFRRTQAGVLNRLTGEEIPLDGSLHPLDAASRLVQEDLIVLTGLDGELVFAAGSVCFPNRWDLRSKLGRPLREVHAPVSGLNDQLGDPIDKFFARLTPERSFWRLGWGVLDSDDLYQPMDGTAAPRPDNPTPEDLVIRVERETLRRFSRTGCVLFTIRTYLSRAIELAAHPDHGPVIAEAIAAMPPGVRAYKQIDRVGDALADLFGRGRSVVAGARADVGEAPGGDDEADDRDRGETDDGADAGGNAVALDADPFVPDAGEGLQAQPHRGQLGDAVEGGAEQPLAEQHDRQRPQR
jgi:hypothetical protein